MDSNSASVAASLDLEGGLGFCALSFTLDVQQIIASVGHDGAGATAVFIGTTRNSFQGKVVTRLEYQAYSTLAIKTLAQIVRDVQASMFLEGSVEAPPTMRCAVHHRLGVVPVGEPSIVIAVSAPHRKEAFIACERLLEEVKRSVQIWKREFYEGESEETAEWKANH
ncbi:molybdenum cofactor synthesis 2 [Mycena alexandri]|uniref:Molybdenum cofactor synthesis 2 n=1 Tax=Mycena alexandri TaxID=1745969 RepID=A0AAD6T2S8_9AGAR|nr:molybdenum cofactor synthesis 2 [Mycena alexandri]